MVDKQKLSGRNCVCLGIAVLEGARVYGGVFRSLRRHEGAGSGGSSSVG